MSDEAPITRRLQKNSGPEGDYSVRPNLMPLSSEAATAQSTAVNAQGMARNIQGQLNDLPDFTVIFDNHLM